VRQLKNVVDGAGLKNGALNDALRQVRQRLHLVYYDHFPPTPSAFYFQVLVELTALLLLHVVRKCEGNPNARQATSMLL
jgi:hypothetical protein